MTTAEGWTGALATAADDHAGRDGRVASLSQAAEALRLVWATEAAVAPATADAELWWLRPAEKTVGVAGLLPPPTADAENALLGSRPEPPATLADTPAPREAAGGLVTATHATRDSH